MFAHLVSVACVRGARDVTRLHGETERTLYLVQ